MQVLIPLSSSYVITDDAYSVDSTQSEETDFIEVFLTKTDLIHLSFEKQMNVLLSDEAKEFLAIVKERALRKMRKEYDSSSWFHKLFYQKP